MSWEDRLRQAAYFPPLTPTRAIRFQYEDVSRETPLRNTPFEFPNVDGAYVQPNGFGAREYPLRCFFNGPDHDIEATIFEEALLQRGAGRLSHPLYGEFDAIPVGRLARRDDLKTRANQTIIQVTFFTTTKLVYPTNQLDARNELQVAIDQFIAENGPLQFEDTANVLSGLSQVQLAATVREGLASVEGALGTAAAATTEVNQLFRDAIDAVNLSLDVLVGQPLQLAQQVSNLISLPARAVTGFTDRVLGYARFARDIFTSLAGRPYDAFASTIQTSNDFYYADLNAGAAINGTFLAAVETEFDTRPGAQEAALAILNLFDEWVEWREPGYDFLLPDQGTSYQALHQGASLAAGLLVEISFTLAAERVLVLDRPRTIIDVAAELYGDVGDETLNLLINNNDLTGSQIIELERGDNILWYG